MIASDDSFQAAVPSLPLTAQAFEDFDDSADIVVLSTTALSDADGRLLEAIHRRRGLVVVIASSFESLPRTLIALASDFLVITRSTTLQIGSRIHPEVAAALVVRIGEAGIGFAEGKSRVLSSDDLLRAGICQSLAGELVGDEVDSVKWTKAWVEGRHVAALASAASLLRKRGGDALENAEFGRLFAAGLPQRGMQRFLNRDCSSFGGAEIVERL